MNIWQNSKLFGCKGRWETGVHCSYISLKAKNIFFIDRPVSFRNTDLNIFAFVFSKILQNIASEQSYCTCTSIEIACIKRKCIGVNARLSTGCI